MYKVKLIQFGDCKRILILENPASEIDAIEKDIDTAAGACEDLENGYYDVELYENGKLIDTDIFIK